MNKKVANLLDNKMVGAYYLIGLAIGVGAATFAVLYGKKKYKARDSRKNPDTSKP